MPWHPVLEAAAVLGEPVDDPAEAVWRTVLRRQAAEAGLLRAGEVVDGARVIAGWGAGERGAGRGVRGDVAAAPQLDRTADAADR
ncbi:hypothetical protein [Streptomyces sp. NPDC001933]|uniref:hypothetical protein n=1 Tax=Streptomyces sp. NPDC001933 TaxID=3364626 RepID=UPI0036CDD56C